MRQCQAETLGTSPQLEDWPTAAVIMEASEQMEF